jgi:glycosyltransferase involved in cell wall biosynthesis
MSSIFRSEPRWAGGGTLYIGNVTSHKEIPTGESSRQHIFVVLPALNEAENLKEVIPELVEELTNQNYHFSILVVDDGSTDETQEVLDYLSKSHSQVEFVGFTRNRGKATVLREGFSYALDAGADIIVMMDADGQDNPVTIPALVRELQSSSDLVTGARYTRRDRPLKKITSKFYNSVTRLMSGTPGSDFNSGLKAMTAPVAQELVPVLYGELHRYITVLVHWFGYRVSEVPADHRARFHGESKYGIARFWRGFLDLITVRFLIAYDSRPFHVFGAAGLLLSSIGLIVLAYLFVLWFGGESIGGRPLLIAGVLFLIAGLQTLFFGLLAEFIVFIRFQDARKPGLDNGAGYRKA